MGRTIIIGDIHGCNGEFCALLEQVSVGEEDRLILLGDLFDRGSESREVFRTVRGLAEDLGDRFVLSLINRRQVAADDFMYQGEKGVVMTDKGRRIFLSAWQNRKRELIVHPYLNEKMPVGLLPYVQAMLLARYVRNDIDDYPVFLFK